MSKKKRKKKVNTKIVNLITVVILTFTPLLSLVYLRQTTSPIIKAANRQNVTFPLYTY